MTTLAGTFLHIIFDGCKPPLHAAPNTKWPVPSIAEVPSWQGTRLTTDCSLKKRFRCPQSAVFLLLLLLLIHDRLSFRSNLLSRRGGVFAISATTLKTCITFGGDEPSVSHLDVNQKPKPAGSRERSQSSTDSLNDERSSASTG